MTRFLIYTFSGLFLGGIIHIVVILMVPAFAPDDAFLRIERLTPVGRTVALKTDTAEGLPLLDPLMAHSVCRYALERGPVRLRAKLPPVFWSVALFNHRGENVYSVNDRAAGGTELDLVILTEEQLSLLRENPPADLEGLLIIEALDSEGFAMLRAFRGDPATMAEVDAAVATASCETRPF